MPNFIVSYVKAVDYASVRFGRIAMYLIFLMIGVLLLGAITRNILDWPLSWTVEMAQFTITAYYIMGGPYSMISDDHVRMDLVYDRCTDKTKARIDTFTNLFLLFYLVVLLIGAISSTSYAIEYGQRKFSQWNPSMVPIKVLMVIGIILMVLQTISTFFKDLAKASGKEIPGLEAIHQIGQTSGQLSGQPTGQPSGQLGVDGVSENAQQPNKPNEDKP